MSKTYHESLLISKCTHVYLRSRDKFTNVSKICIYVNYTYVSKFAHVKGLKKIKVNKVNVNKVYLF